MRRSHQELGRQESDKIKTVTRNNYHHSMEDALELSKTGGREIDKDLPGKRRGSEMETR